MASPDRKRPGHWHDLELQLRRYNLKLALLNLIRDGNEDMIPRLFRAWGLCSKEFLERLERARSLDPERRAAVLSRLCKREVRRHLADDLWVSGQAALAAQIDASISMYEESHGLSARRTPEDLKAWVKRRRTVESEVARAEEVYSKRPSAKLRAAIEKWKDLQRPDLDHLRLLARLPLATLQDPDLFLLVRGNLRDREIAAKNLIDRAFVSPELWLRKNAPGRSRVEAELIRLHDAHGATWVYRWLKSAILPAALVLAADDATSGNAVRIRLGKRWVLDLDGKQALVDPLELTDEELRDWLRMRVIQRAEEGILGERSSVQRNMEPLEDEPESDVLSPEAAMLRREKSRLEQERLSRFLECFQALSAADQQLLALRAERREYEEISKILGGTLYPSPKSLRILTDKSVE